MSTVPLNEGCRLCGGSTSEAFSARVLGRYDVRYFQCAQCGLLQTERPTWLSEAYASSLSMLDTAAASRNLAMAMQTAVLSHFLLGAERGLDFAGGSGLFTRYMRDFGFDWYWSDALTQNTFARGFECTPSMTSFDLVTAFECFEHFVDPVKEIGEIFSLGRNVLISTDVLPEPPPAPERWYYYGLDHGQHIAFYSRRTLEFLARKYGRHLRSFGTSVHLFSEKPIPDWKAHAVFKARKPLFLYVQRQRKSRSHTDGELLRARGRE